MADSEFEWTCLLYRVSHVIKRQSNELPRQSSQNPANHCRFSGRSSNCCFWVHAAVVWRLNDQNPAIRLPSVHDGPVRPQYARNGSLNVRLPNVGIDLHFKTFGVSSTYLAFAATPTVADCELEWLSPINGIQHDWRMSHCGSRARF